MPAGLSGGSSSPRDKHGRKLITREEYEFLAAKFTNDRGEEMQAHEIKGFYLRKIRYNVKTVNDVIMKLRKTAVCDKFFLQSDLQFCGL